MRYIGRLLVAIAVLIISFHEVSAHEMPTYTHMQPVVPITFALEDGSLLLSNSPETVKKCGLLFNETWQGKGRIVYHHANGMKGKAVQLIIWLENQTEEMSIITIGKLGQQGPSYQYLKAGEKALADFFSSWHQKMYLLMPNEKQIIYKSPETGWPKDTILTGLFDINTTIPVSIHIGVFPIDEVWENCMNYSLLPKSVEERGKFQTLTICQSVVLPSTGEYFYLIEDGKEKWQKGKDGSVGVDVINYGNYGIIYKITIFADEKTEMFICPRGGIFQGVIKWDNGKIFSIKRDHFFKTTKESVWLATLQKGESRTFEYMLPNGSAAPVLLGFKVIE